ncbi:MAG: DUF962 domain-containing protein, partial [Polyangiaceae bacterium]
LPLNRAFHYVGTSMAIGTVGAAVLTANPLWLLATPVVGYGPAWFGHFILEKNRPATFKAPLYSLRGDLRMLKYALQGKMAKEVERLHGPLSGSEAGSSASEGAKSGAQAAEDCSTNGVTHENGAVVGGNL